MNNELTDYELEKLKGGAVHWALIAAGIGAGISFLIGVVDGYLRPYACRK